MVFAAGVAVGSPVVVVAADGLAPVLVSFPTGEGVDVESNEQAISRTATLQEPTAIVSPAPRMGNDVRWGNHKSAVVPSRGPASSSTLSAQSVALMPQHGRQSATLHGHACTMYLPRAGFLGEPSLFLPRQ